MKTTPLLQICSRLLRGPFLAALATASLTLQNAWAAPFAQQAYLKASNTGTGDGFGLSAALSGDMVVIGADGEDSNATGVNGDQSDDSTIDSGAAYVFVRNGTNWIQQAYLKASNPRAGDNFGWPGSVAVSGDTIVVGALFEDSNATGVNGDQTDSSATDSGAAYVFIFMSQIAIAADGTGGYLIDIQGRPNATYRLQRARSVSGPWVTIDTQTAPASGLIEYHETTSLLDATFYCTVTP